MGEGSNINGIPTGTTNQDLIQKISGGASNPLYQSWDAALMDGNTSEADEAVESMKQNHSIDATTADGLEAYDTHADEIVDQFKDGGISQTQEKTELSALQSQQGTTLVSNNDVINLAKDAPVGGKQVTQDLSNLGNAIASGNQANGLSALLSLNKDLQTEVNAGELSSTQATQVRNVANAVDTAPNGSVAQGFLNDTNDANSLVSNSSDNLNFGPFGQEADASPP